MKETISKFISGLFNVTLNVVVALIEKGKVKIVQGVMKNE